MELPSFHHQYSTRLALLAAERSIARQLRERNLYHPVSPPTTTPKSAQWSVTQGSTRNYQPFEMKTSVGYPTERGGGYQGVSAFLGAVFNLVWGFKIWGLGFESRV